MSLGGFASGLATAFQRAEDRYQDKKARKKLVQSKTCSCKEIKHFKKRCTLADKKMTIRKKL